MPGQLLLLSTLLQEEPGCLLCQLGTQYSALSCQRSPVSTWSQPAPVQRLSS